MTGSYSAPYHTVIGSNCGPYHAVIGSYSALYLAVIGSSVGCAARPGTALEGSPYDCLPDLYLKCWNIWC